MDKNFVFAFLLILGVFLFFNSDFYNYTLLHKEKKAATTVVAHPAERANPNGAPNKTPSGEAVPSLVAEAPAAAENAVVSALSPDSLLFSRQKKIFVVTDLYIAEFTTVGARAISWRMKEFKDQNNESIDLLPGSMGGMFNLSVDKDNYDFVQFSSNASDTVFVRDQKTVTFTYVTPEGSGVEKTFSFKNGSYDFDVALRLLGNAKREAYTFGWKSGIVETEKDINSRYTDNPISVYFGDDVDCPVEKADTAKEVEGTIKWVSLRSKYFSGTFIPDKAGDYEVNFRKLHDLTRTHNDLNFSFDITGKLDSSAFSYKIILCPNKYSILKAYDIKLEKIIFKGYTWFFRADLWFPLLCGLVLNILNFFYRIIPNYGVAILFLTLLSKIVTLPLTLKSSRSMARMKLLQPKMQAIREKYKSDQLTMNKMVMKLYKDEGVNPLGAGGCLPMVLQMPIFIALFVGLRKAIELRGAPFVFWIKDLSGPEAMFMLPSKIFFYGPNVSLLTVIMAVTMFFQSKQTMTDPKQKSLIYIMPVVMLFMLNNMPAGLMLYWSFSNILGIFQNMMIKVNPEDLINKPKPKRSLFKPLSYNEMLRRMGRK